MLANITEMKKRAFDFYKNKTYSRDKQFLLLNKEADKIKWINNYHKNLKRNLSRYMNSKEKLELTEACSPI